MDNMDKILKKLQILQANSKELEPKEEVTCDLCKDKGVYYNPKTDTAGKCPACGNLSVSTERLKRYGLFDRVMENTLENYVVSNDETKMALQNTLSFLDEFNYKQSIMYCGQVGSGKTHLALAIVKELMGEVPVLPFIYVQEMATLRVLRNSYNSDERLRYDEKINACREAKLLLIEDLFWGKVSDIDLAIAYDIINYRVSTNKAMIITTELNRQQLLELDEALGSRLIYMCGDNIVEFKHDIRNNYRLK